MEADRVVRKLREPLPASHFLNSALARAWRDRGDLVDFTIVDDHTVTARRLPFVSLPAEWCDLQLFHAAELTLRLQGEAVEAGYDLKDASAWNVLFDSGRPVFCDLLSFEPLTRKRWWAAGQFARHFLLPLLLSDRRGLPAHKTFQAWRDGVPHDVARRMMGAPRFLTRYWPLMAQGGGTSAVVETPAREASDLDAIRRFRVGLNSSLGWMLRGVDPRRRLPGPSAWGDYVNERGHYSDADLLVKRERVAEWARTLAPVRALDLGCNSGEFSRLVAAASAQTEVIGVDLDAGAISRAVVQGGERLHFLVAPLDDLRGGYGWSGQEHAGLTQRLGGHADLTLMLALVHHLTIGASIPLPAVAAFAAAMTRRWLVIELIAPEDVQIALMQSQRDRSDALPAIDEQLRLFQAAGLAVRERVQLPTGTRELVLFERMDP
jgi:SAM-dependent methyltransferase